MLERSPQIKYKVNYCGECDSQIVNASGVKCDNCEKLFHENCSVQKNEESLGDIIWICNKCTDDNSICTKKDITEIKSSSSPENTKRLRSIILTDGHNKKVKKNVEIKSGDIKKLNITRQKR